MTENELKNLIDELRALPSETEWVEFKESRFEQYETGEYISALSNSACLHDKDKAYLVFGIKDKTHQVVGTSVKLKQKKIGNEELENWLARLLSPHVDFKIVEFDYDNHLISMVIIDPACNQPIRFQNTAYIRVGSYKRKLPDFPEKERKIWGKTSQTVFETDLAMKNVNEDEVLQLLDYPSYFRLLELDLPENRDAILSRLADDYIIRPSEAGQWSIMNLGAILFASDLSQFRHLARKALRVIEYDGDGRVTSKREHLGHKGYAAGFEGLIGFLKGILPENEVIGEALRKSVPMYPELAIRELVANVIIHQDFTITGTGPMVEIFDNRLEITNPGKPLVDTNRFLDTPPKSRNESLASFLRRIGICEERGSGVDKVVFQTELYQLPAPLFEVVGDHTRAVLFAHSSFAAMDKADRIRACYLHACLQHVQRKRLTNTSLRDRFGVDKKNSAQISRVIGDTIQAGLVHSYNPDSESRRHASYVPFWA